MMGMSKIVKTISSIAFPLSLIYGLYIIAHGHLTPGGGFQGGAIVASACAMILVSYGSVWTMKKIKEKHLSALESLGAIAFIGFAFLGLIIGTAFFNNALADEPGGIFGNIGEGLSDINTGGVIPFMNFAVGLKAVSYTHLTLPTN